MYVVWAILWLTISLICLLIVLFTRHRSSEGAIAASFTMIAGMAAAGSASEKYWWIPPIYFVCFFAILAIKFLRFILKHKP
jgi:hypothetical protein